MYLLYDNQEYHSYPVKKVMYDFEKNAMLSSLQSGGLGMLVGGIFAIVGFKPPSPDNLSGILGIVGIYVGWVLVRHFIK